MQIVSLNIKKENLCWWTQYTYSELGENTLKNEREGTQERVLKQESILLELKMSVKGFTHSLHDQMLYVKLLHSKQGSGKLVWMVTDLAIPIPIIYSDSPHNEHLHMNCIYMNYNMN